MRDGRPQAFVSLAGGRMPTWKTRSACAGLVSRWYDPWSCPDSAKKPCSEAQRICDACPVRVACLDEAMELGEKHTVRGGTTHKQRCALKRLHVRSTCPICGQKLEPEVIEDDLQICYGCGYSWGTLRQSVTEDDESLSDPESTVDLVDGLVQSVPA